MVHVPMQDRRQTELAQMGEFDAQRPACQLQMTRRLDQAPEGHTLQRHRVPPPQRVQIDAVPEIRRDHRQAGQPAFGGLGLQHDGQPGASPKIQILLLHAHILL